MLLRDRIEALDSALRSSVEIDIPVRHSTDHRFDNLHERPSPRTSPKLKPVIKEEKVLKKEKKDKKEKKQSNGANLYATLYTTALSAPPPKVKDLEKPKAKSEVTYKPEEKTKAVVEKTEPEIDPLRSLHHKSIAESYGLRALDHADEYTEFDIFDAFVTNLRVCPVHLQGNYYYVEHRSFLPQVPGAILRSGHDKGGRALGAAHLPYIGSNRIGLGDFEHDPHNVTWEQFSKTGKFTHMTYEFAWSLPDGARRTFRWIRTRNMVLDDQGDLVLVEDGHEDVVLCEYIGKGLLKWKKRGSLRVKVVQEFGEEWEKVVLLSWAAVVEMSRRRARQRRISALHLL